MKFAKVLLLVLFVVVSPMRPIGSDAFAANSISSSSSCYGLARMTAGDGLVIDKRYATKSNFVGFAFEEGADSVCLHPIAADKLKISVRRLNDIRPGWQLVIFDGLRTQRQQRLLWNIVKGTDRAKYVADPDKGSIHSFGFAVDLSIQDEHKNLLDMGTEFDSFLPLAEPRREAEFLKSGKLTKDQISNRKLLREVMSKAGFQFLPIEWWHFDALSPNVVRSQYRQVK